MLCSRSPVSPICRETSIRLISGSVIDLAVVMATQTPTNSATSVLTMENRMVSALAVSSDLRRSSTSLRFSPSATSSASVEFFTHEGSVFLKVVNLQFGNGRVAGIHVLTFVDQRLREFFAPGLFQLFDLVQR